MAQAISNTTNPYNPANLVSGLLKPVPYSGIKLKNQISTPAKGITSGPNQNMSPYTGGGLVQKPTAPKPTVAQAPQAPAPAPVAPVAMYNGNSPYTAPGTSAGQPINQNIPAPQTGNVSTPSGAVVNSANGSLVSPPPSPFRGLFPDVVSSLAGRGTHTNPMIEESYRRAQGLAENLRQSRQNQSNAEAQQRLAPIPIGDATGRQAITRQQYETQQAALSQQLAAEAALAGIGQGVQTAQQSALGSAAGFAQPQVTGYGQTTFNPLTGTFGGATGGGGGAFDPQTQAMQLAQEVANGSRTYGDAISALGYAGSAGATFLNNALRQVAPNFNFSQAQALGTVQGQVAPQLQMAQAAIDNLSNTFGNTPWFQKTGLPLVNTFSNMVAQVTGFGLGTETAKQNAIKEARTQVANALGVMTNTTPTAWTTTVESWFPDSATPDQVEAGIEQFTNLAANRQQIYGAPGQVTPFGSGGGSTSGFDW